MRKLLIGNTDKLLCGQIKRKSPGVPAGKIPGSPIMKGFWKRENQK